MSLFNDLKKAALALDPQFQVTSNEVQGVVSALAHYADHGPKFLEAAAAGAEDVANLLAPKTEQDSAAKETGPAAAAAEAPSDAPAAAPPAAVPVSAPEPSSVSAPAAADFSNLSDEELAAVLADLQQVQASRQATGQQTQVDHNTGGTA